MESFKLGMTEEEVENPQSNEEMVDQLGKQRVKDNVGKTPQK